MWSRIVAVNYERVVVGAIWGVIYWTLRRWFPVDVALAILVIGIGVVNWCAITGRRGP